MTTSDEHDHTTPDGAVVVDCDELFANLDVLLDRELPQEELDRLETHLAACLPCAGRRDFESQLRAVVRERCADQAPADLVARIRTALELPGR